MKIYKCPKCGAVAKIDPEKKRMVIEPSAPKIPQPGTAIQVAFSFPSHPDCEFNKPVTEIDVSKLILVKDHEFRFEKGVPPI